MSTATTNGCCLQDIASRQHQRRHFLIYRRFQLRMALFLAAIVFLACVMMSAALYGILHEQARLRFMAPDTYTAEVPLVLFGFALGFALLTSGALGLWCVLATRRICGPLVLLRQYFDELAEGRFPVIRPLRRHEDPDVRQLHEAFARALHTLQAKCRS